jgi:Mlc titration factor MtfA (ptsG expression regulator)
LATLFFVALMPVLLAWVLREPWLAAWRRWRLARRPFPAEWRRIVRQRVPYVATMPADLQLQLKRRMQVFLAEKPFIGCGGLEVSDEMRVTVATQACLLLLNQRGAHFEDLRQILLYPGPFVVDRSRTDAMGLQHEQRQVLQGESWQQGQVILSWPDVLEGASVVDDGRNVVIHEFAHQRDQENGRANGAPLLFGQQRRTRWARVMSREYAALRRRLAAGEPTLLDAYGATAPAEFFAVASEVFFEQSALLAEQHPALYRELSGYYRINPLSW